MVFYRSGDASAGPGCQPLDWAPRCGQNVPGPSTRIQQRGARGCGSRGAAAGQAGVSEHTAPREKASCPTDGSPSSAWHVHRRSLWGLRAGGCQPIPGATLLQGGLQASSQREAPRTGSAPAPRLPLRGPNSAGVFSPDLPLHPPSRAKGPPSTPGLSPEPGPSWASPPIPSSCPVSPRPLTPLSEPPMPQPGRLVPGTPAPSCPLSFRGRTAQGLGAQTLELLEIPVPPVIALWLLSASVSSPAEGGSPVPSCRTRRGLNALHGAYPGLCWPHSA